MTTRKGFFTALLTIATAAIGKAQQAIVITPCRPKIRWGQQPELCNGQCPNSECDYIAPEFPKRELHWDEIEKWQAIGELYWDYRHPTQLIPSKRLNRCPKCSMAYWQDPQEVKE